MGQLMINYENPDPKYELYSDGTTTEEILCELLNEIATLNKELYFLRMRQDSLDDTLEHVLKELKMGIGISGHTEVSILEMP